MPSRWSAEQVLALAPDGASVAAARGLASPGRWCGAGTDADACCAADPDADPAGRAGGPSAVWGACQGAGPGPYRTVVDLGGPAYRCTCPSRKVPCKHAVGLLLLWAAGHVRPGPPPDWAEEWLASRAARAAAGTARVAGADAGPGDPEAARRRAERRAARVTAGLEELDLWLTDQVRAGLAGVQRAGYTYVEQVAARMVDAQAPGVAGALRRLPGVLATGEAWPAASSRNWARCT